MKKTTLTISFEKEKLDALQYFMEKKSLDLQTELQGTLENLWQKHIPSAVKEYILDTTEDSPSAKKAKESEVQNG